MLATFSRRVLYILLCVDGALLLMHVVFMRLSGVMDPSSLGYQVLSRFNVDAEASIPTWFAQALLLLASLLLGVIAYHKKRGGDRFAWHWCALVVLFLYLSADEAAVLHELWAEPFRHAFSIEQGPLFFAWVLPAACGIILLALGFYRFFRHLPRVMQRYLGVAFAAFLFGAMGMEMISGAYWSHTFSYDMQYQFYNLIEEGLEMTAVIFGVATLVWYIEERRMFSLSEG